MNIIGQNLKLRRMPAAEWRELEKSLCDAMGRLDGVVVQSLQPGLIELSLDRPSSREYQATMEHIRASWPDWRFSEGGTYSLSAPVDMRVLG